MSPSGVIGEAWEMYKAHWRHFIPIALAVYVLLSLFTLLLVALLGPFGALAAVFVTLAGAFWVQGALVVAIADVRDGRADLSLGGTLARVRPRMNTLGVAGLLAAFGVTLGLIFFVVPGLVLLTWWIVIVPVIMLEDAGVRAAFGRSRELVRGNAWSAFGVILLTILVLIAISIAVAIALFWLPDEIQSYVQNILGSSLSAPFAALAWTILYYRLRGEPAAAPAPATAGEFRA